MPNITVLRVLIVLGALGLAAAFCLAHAYFIEPSRLVVRNAEIFVDGWDKEYDGLRIAMISDIHGGSNDADEEMIQKVVELVNRSDPDLVVLLGDYISEAEPEPALKMPMNVVADNLKALKARHGVFAVLGNHDIWHDREEIRAELERVGITVLEHEAVRIERQGKPLRILGLKDHTLARNWGVYSEQAKDALAQIENEGKLVILEHSPDMIKLVTGELEIDKDLKLFLAGHTHGGQVWLPLIGAPIVPSSYGQTYAHGEIVESGVHVYVTSGVGTSILPFRFLVPPEVVILTIRSKEH